jgi:hypothetical protein
MFFRFPPDAHWSPERSAVEFGIGVGEYEGVVRVGRRVFQPLLHEAATVNWSGCASGGEAELAWWSAARVSLCVGRGGEFDRDCNRLAVVPLTETVKPIG